MKLFHGSNAAIKAIDLDRCKPYKDFGLGFYLTEIEQQAILMARRTASIYGGEAVVTVFEFDESAALNDSELSVIRFDEPNEEWAIRSRHCSEISMTVLLTCLLWLTV